MAFVKVATINDVKDGEGKVVKVGDKEIGLFNVNGTFYAIENACKHQGGPLGEGWTEDTVVNCPWHGWRYDLKTGQNEQFPDKKVGTFPVKVEGEDVLVDA